MSRQRVAQNRPYRVLQRIGVFVLIAAALYCAGDRYLSAQSKSAKIAGIAVGPEGDGLAGVGVFLEGDSPKAVTDALGRFVIEGIERGRHRVTPVKGGFVYSSPTKMEIPVEPGLWVDLSRVESQHVRIGMVREAVITGTVLDALGKSIPNSTVSLLRYSYDSLGYRRLAPVPGIARGSSPSTTQGNALSFVRVDDRGQYRFFGLQAGDYYVGFGGGPAGPGRMRVGVYYPGTVDERQALRIYVGAGDHLQLQSVVLEERKAVQVRFRLPSNLVELPLRVTVRLGDSGLMTTSVVDRQIVIPAVMAGHYDVLVYWTSYPGARLLYSTVNLNVTNADVDQELVVQRGVKVTGNVLLEEANRQRRSLEGVHCSFQAHELGVVLSAADNGCSGEFSAGKYHFNLLRMPPNSYVLSATASGRDVLREGLLQIGSDTGLEIVLATPAGVVAGTVTDFNGQPVSNAVVAVIPDPPLQSAGLLYRHIVADQAGHFEIDGIAPGSFHLFAWVGLEGAAYRNADFMKQFENTGKAISVQKGSRISMDVVASGIASADAK